ncbi:MAG: hypothetical protein RQM95_08680 [Syntrophaceticus schinkii]
MSKRWLKDFLRYINKVFLPEGCTKWAKDERKDPEIEPGTIWVTLLIGFALQVQSLEELERRAKESFKKLLPRKQRPPSADTIRHSSIGMELEPIKKLYIAVINKARRSKMLPTIDHYRVAAIDGQVYSELRADAVTPARKCITRMGRLPTSIRLSPAR